MAEFEVKVYKLTIEEHPNADALELAIVGDYRSIVRKGQFKSGNKGIYIPEASIVPEWIIKEMGLEGRLAGSKHNRVKAVKLRSILSQGLIYPLINNSHVEFPTDSGKMTISVHTGDELSEKLGIIKWEPPIPTQLAGEVDASFGKTISYDIENYKKFPDILLDNEEVVMTEKGHGTFCCFGYHPELDKKIVTSKGLSSKGLTFKLNEKNKGNLYIKTLNNSADQSGNDLLDRLHSLLESNSFLGYTLNDPIYILGEVIGKGVQDLQYGFEIPQFKAFDIYVGYPNKGLYLSVEPLKQACIMLNIEQMPVLYKGKFSKEVMLEHTDGKETLSGNEKHMREGVVIVPIQERYDNLLGRVKLKSVSDKYLLRKNATEFN